MNIPLNILLLEDNPGDARLVIAYLHEAFPLKVNITDAERVSDAVNLLSKGRYDIIISDMSLPDSFGIETFDTLYTRFPHIPIIVLTGFGDDTFGMLAVKKGAQDFLNKNRFDSDILKKSILYSIERNKMLNNLSTYTKKLEISEKNLADAQRIAGIGNWDWDIDNELFMASDQLYRIYGYSPKEVKINFEWILDKIHPEDRDRVRKNITDPSSLCKPFEHHFRIIRKDGEVRIIHERGEVLFLEAGEPLFVKTIDQDVTEIKLAENRLSESELKYRSLFEESNDAIYICTTEGNFVDFNKAAMKLFGYSSSEMKSLNIFDLYIEQSDKERFINAINKSGNLKDFEVILKKKNGDIIECVESSSLRLDEKGNYLFHGIVRDVTERRKLEELRRAKEVAEKTSKMKDKWIANLSHEIRTPMNVIIGMSELLMRSKPTQEQLEYLNAIYTSAESLMGIIQDILDVSKIDAGKMRFEEKEFNSKSLVANVAYSFKFKAMENDIELKTQIDSNVPEKLIGDPVRLEQILYNLLNNAIKFTEKGGISVSMHLDEESEENVLLRLSVSDTGIGIPKESQDLIFESFTQLDSNTTKKYQGTGLGLAIVKKIVDLQGGKIVLESTPGKGSVFNVYLPYKKAIDAKEKEETVSNIPDDLKDVKILLVEDNPMNQMLIVKILEKWNAVPDIAVNGKDAIEKALNKDYDIILMDIQMPEMDGYEATHNIRMIQGKKFRSPIIALTAYTNKGEQEKCLAAGMDDYISKPINIDNLLMKISKHVYKNKKSQDPA